jgi:hypothetical protein
MLKSSLELSLCIDVLEWIILLASPCGVGLEAKAKVILIRRATLELLESRGQGRDFSRLFGNKTRT